MTAVLGAKIHLANDLVLELSEQNLAVLLDSAELVMQMCEDEIHARAHAADYS